MTQHRDPVTKTPVTATRPLSWDLAGVPEDADVQAIADALYAWLDEKSRGQDGSVPDGVSIVGHAADSFVTDHVLLTSAIAYCLAHDAGRSAEELHLIRLAALSHELEDTAGIAGRLSDAEAEFLRQAWDTLAEQGTHLDELVKNNDSLSAFAGAEPPTGDERLAVLWKAHLTASNRLHNHEWSDPDAPADEWGRVRSLASQGDFEQHPLKGAGQIGLVFGGATKIKSYVFESARLPEVRGASTLFDRLNTLDVPALWGRKPQRSDYGEGAEAEEAYNSARERYDAVHQNPAALLAPECIIYASGGNVLALAPVELAHNLADAVERLYTEETLTGNSAAVAETFDLLEIQYGRHPHDFWLEDFAESLESTELKPILESYYKSKPDRALEPFDFVVRKGFGELATVLAGAMNRRRAGRGGEKADENENGANKRLERAIPYYELLPQTIKCHSCDTRPALVTIVDPEVTPAQSPKVFCEPCARKRVAGLVAKRDDPATNWFDLDKFGWEPLGVRPSWEGKYEMFLAQHPDLHSRYHASQDKNRQHRGSDNVIGAQDIQEIGGASSPDGYIGYIYADGNDVGALVARIRTPAAYRQFGQRLYLASQAAVFTAFGRHLSAHYQEKSPDPERADRDNKWLHPFEIITIGGDDLITIVPGHRALEIATTISHELEHRLAGPRPEKAWTPDEKARHERYKPESAAEADALWTEERWPAISLSAGVVIARDHTPIPYVSELAEQLQKSAKGARKRGKLAKLEDDWDKRPEYPGGTVDFAALKATGMVSLPWEDYRKRAFGQKGDREFTARPYTWHELRGLVHTARVLKAARFPRSQMYRLQDDLEGSLLEASLNYLYFLTHLDSRSDIGRQVMEGFHYAWHRSTDVPPWRMVRKGEENGKRYETVWRDLVEIYDFVPHPEEREEDSD